jgi:methylenetetrahydrofolate dehydrogenase (NADP+) / methenyltetrahydrofolate cyclohydrolase
LSATILYAKPIADRIRCDIANKVKARIDKGLAAPGLAVIVVGNNPASATYVKHKQAACEKAGIISTCHRLDAATCEQEIATLIDKLNHDPAVHGILLQLPLPEIDMVDRLLERIDPKKDVDGFHPYNIGRLALRQPLLRPCTPWGVIKLLEFTGEPLAGKHAVIIGASNIVGRPMALELLLKKCTVTVCHRHTKDLQAQIEHADILVTAMGNPGVIKSDWIKPGAMVIDVGFSKLSNGKISGDMDFESAKERAGWITPVPGGVGLMTVTMLLDNALLAADLT